MDFAKPLQCEPSVASRSNIRYIIPTTSRSETNGTASAASSSKDVVANQASSSNPQVALDDMLLQEANAAAVDLLLGDSCPTLQQKNPAVDEDDTKQQEQERLLERQVDAALYPERCRVTKDTIQEGDLVVILISFDNLSFLYAKAGEVFSNRNGHFHHDDFLHKPYGCKIRSRNNRGYGFCYLLKPTPELWSRSLNHRTQIVHELDQSQILFQLHLRPNAVVVESGTGSGAMSHAILRSIAPAGHLHTYEFNQQRAETARQEFQQHGLLQNLVTVHHADVCGKKPIVTSSTTVAAAAAGSEGDDAAATTSATTSATTTAVNDNGGGFGLPGQSVDAVFLDLPEPWLAVPHAAFVLKAGGRIASYSPCMEQTQRTIQAMQVVGFHSMKTMEFRLQEHYVDEMEYESPPRNKRPRLLDQHPQQPLFQQQQHQQQQNSASKEDDKVDGEETINQSNNNKNNNSHLTMQEMEEDKVAAAAAAVPAALTSDDSKQEEGQDKEVEPLKKNAMLVARPFTMMRGHTAFLTFATAGNFPQPTPAATKNVTAPAIPAAAKSGKQELKSAIACSNQA